MAQTAPSHANPIMLKWARKTERLSIDDVASLEKLDAEKIRGWESGQDTPSMAVLNRLAKRYKRYTMVFYLKEPPEEFSVKKVKDFRILPSGASSVFSRELQHAIRAVQDRQAWAREHFQDEAVPESNLIASYSLAQSPKDIGHELRNTIGITVNMQAKCGTDSQSFSMWREGVEQIGIFAFQASGVAVEEMRGFAITDNFAPAVAVNINDAYTARTFTLIHEVAHILIGETGVTGGGEQAISPFTRRNIEKFCNAVAAETLVPENDFRHRVPRDWISNDDEVLRNLSGVYGVSRAVIAFRLYETGFAERKYLSSKLAMLSRTAIKKRSRGGPPQHKKVVARNGVSFSQLAVSAFREGVIHGGALSSLLNMKLKHLSNLESVLFPGRAQPVSRR